MLRRALDLVSKRSDHQFDLIRFILFEDPRQKKLL